MASLEASLDGPSLQHLPKAGARHADVASPDSQQQTRFLLPLLWMSIHPGGQAQHHSPLHTEITEALWRRLQPPSSSWLQSSTGTGSAAPQQVTACPLGSRGWVDLATELLGLLSSTFFTLPSFACPEPQQHRHFPSIPVCRAWLACLSLQVRRPPLLGLPTLK